MPKITPWKDKETWYTRVEGGESVATLAREFQKDPRTLQRGIDEVRRHRAAKEAREALLRESLRHHLEDLLGLVQRAARVVLPPPLHPDLRSPGTEAPRLLELGPIRVERQDDWFDKVVLDLELEFTWALLREHLGRSHEFRLLGRWKKAFLAALDSQLGFRDYLLTRLQEDLGLNLGDDIGRPGTIRPAAAAAIATAAVSRLLGEEPPYELRVEPGENGEFLVNGLGGGRLSGDGKPAQLALGSLLESVMCSPAAHDLVQAYRLANNEAAALKESLELVRASHYLQGTCRACRRYGGI